ncbi:phosphopantetheine-binding protein [unidentified bacterial endosymbiont]|uniref:phosphopantetheine-binding protein n=1 Tax=unidentified bacterial endosymbiont TaxID=2355 RepID=UPI00209F9C6A|nr:phosphopantetheine-binding protein [unidentified bacterial endosymbiont]
MMESRDDIFDSLKQRIMIMKDHNESEVLMESTFESLKFDSLDYIELQVYIQESYAIKIPDQLLYQRTIASIEDAVNYILN